jgi:hypothetical protein
MLQQPCDFGRSIRGSERFLEQLRGHRRFRVVRGCDERWFLPASPLVLKQVVDETDTVTAGDREYFMLAVGVKGSEGQFRNLARAQVDRGVSASVADHELTACVRRRQHDQQGAEHAVCLFGVAMRFEEGAFVIHEHLVKLTRYVRARATEPFSDGREDLFKGVRPGFAADIELRRRELPNLAYRGIEDGFAAAAVRSTLALRDNGLDLCARDRERQNSDAADVDARHRRFE